MSADVHGEYPPLPGHSDDRGGGDVRYYRSKGDGTVEEIEVVREWFCEQGRAYLGPCDPSWWEGDEHPWVHRHNLCGYRSYLDLEPSLRRVPG